GRVTTDFGVPFQGADAVLVQPDGNIVVVGTANRHVALARHRGAAPSNLTGSGVLRGRVFHDANADGQDAGPNEGPLVGWTVYLDLNHNGQYDDGIDRPTTTLADGTYEFDALGAGTYTVGVKP